MAACGAAAGGGGAVGEELESSYSVPPSTKWPPRVAAPRAARSGGVAAIRTLEAEAIIQPTATVQPMALICIRNICSQREASRSTVSSERENSSSSSATPTPGKLQGGGSSAAIMAAARRKKARSPHDDDDGGGEWCQNESAHAGTQLQRMPVWLHLCCSPLCTPLHFSALIVSPDFERKKCHVLSRDPRKQRRIASGNRRR